mgnify:CR=1 FL=1
MNISETVKSVEASYSTAAGISAQCTIIESSVILADSHDHVKQSHCQDIQ